jgi:hypothetical protein
LAKEYIVKWTSGFSWIASISTFLIFFFEPTPLSLAKDVLGTYPLGAVT